MKVAAQLMKVEPNGGNGHVPKVVDDPRTEELAAGDEVAFDALLRRHGPMVYRLCWRVLQNIEECEDAFQATFLLLAQKLNTVKNRDSLAAWLHGVAHRVALSARSQHFLGLAPHPFVDQALIDTLRGAVCSQRRLRQASLLMKNGKGEALPFLDGTYAY